MLTAFLKEGALDKFDENLFSSFFNTPAAKQTPHGKKVVDDVSKELHALAFKKEEKAENLVLLKSSYKTSHYAEPDLQDQISSD